MCRCVCVCVTVCCADSHQFEAAVAEDILIIKKQPAEKQKWNEKEKEISLKKNISYEDKFKTFLKATMMKHETSSGAAINVK